MNQGWQFKLVSCAVLGAFTHSVFAEPISLPGSAQPSVVGNALTSQQPSYSPQVSPPLVGAQPQQGALLNEKVRNITFRLDKIVLEGNHVYPTAVLEPIYKNDLHKTITVAEAFNIMQKITNYYRNNGYILSRAILPPQKIDKGIMRIQIIEGYIGNVKVIGNPRGARCLVQMFGNQIKKCPPLKLSRLERYLLLMNEIPGTQVRAELAPAKGLSGAADLGLDTTIHTVTGYLSYDNYGTRYIGPQQMTANLALNSFVISGDSAQITYTKTPKGGELTYTDINYNIPINDQGARWVVGGARTHTHPLFVLRPAQIDGLNPNFYTTVYIPTIRTRTQSLTWRVGFNYLDSWVDSLRHPLYTDHLRPLDLGVTWNFSDVHSGVNTISGDFRQGLPIWGYTSNTSKTAKTSRPGGRGRFSKIAAQANRTQAFDYGWSLYGVVQGQWAFSPLLSAEQFTFGGPVLGRGYDIAELIGDKGAAFSLELRYDKSFTKVILQSLEFYAFYDAGIYWNYLLEGGVPRQQSATSAGTGVRFYFSKYISGNLMWTQPLTKYVAAEQLIGRGWRPRVFFSVVGSFS